MNGKQTNNPQLDGEFFGVHCGDKYQVVTGQYVEDVHSPSF